MNQTLNENINQTQVIELQIVIEDYETRMAPSPLQINMADHEADCV